MGTFLGIDYPTIWFIIVLILFAGYAILDGFDFGAGAWHLFMKDDKERRIALNAVGPVWDGNEVWLIIGGASLFAGFPLLYASLFSGMYIPFILFLTFIIFRAVSIEFRSKEPMLWWRKTWDVVYCVSSITLPVLLGVVLGNVMIGIEIGPNYIYQGGALFTFLNPYALSVGLLSLSAMILHGGAYLLIKTQGEMHYRLSNMLPKAAYAFVGMFVLVSLYTNIGFPHLRDKVTTSFFTLLPAVLVFVSIAYLLRMVHARQYRNVFFASATTIGLMLVMVGIEVYPVLTPSTIDAAYNINIYNAAASNKSYETMLQIVVMGFPLILFYTAFVYRTFFGKVKLDGTSY